MGLKEDLLNLLNNKSKARKWITKGLRSLKVEDVKQSIQQNSNPSVVLFNHFGQYTMNPLLSPIIKLVLKFYWDEMEEVLTDATKVYNQLIENRPDMKEILDQKKGRRWLNYAVASSYASLYTYVWK